MRRADALVVLPRFRLFFVVADAISTIINHDASEVKFSSWSEKRGRFLTIHSTIQGGIIAIMIRMLTISQIHSQFESEWVLVEDPITNDALEVQSGKVRYHSKDRDEVYRKAVELRPKRFAMLYTGTIPKNVAIVL